MHLPPAESQLDTVAVEPPAMGVGRAAPFAPAVRRKMPQSGQCQLGSFTVARPGGAASIGAAQFVSGVAWEGMPLLTELDAWVCRLVTDMARLMEPSRGELYATIPRV